MGLIGILCVYYLSLILKTVSWNCCTNHFNCDGNPIHCVGDTTICDKRDGNCIVECESDINNPTGNTCSTNDAGCCQSEIFCPV